MSVIFGLLAVAVLVLAVLLPTQKKVRPVRRPDAVPVRVRAEDRKR